MVKDSLFYLLRFCVIAAFIASVIVFLPVTAQEITPPPPVEGPAKFIIDDGATQNFSGCGGGTAPVLNSQYENRVIELVNTERAAHALPPLKRITLLDDASRYHAKDMADDNYFDHNTFDRSGSNLVQVCAWSSRITSYYSSWSTLGENIAAGYSTPEAVMNAWMNSDGHRANILRDTFWEIGVGYYEGGGSYYRYWVQDFGRRNNIYPIVINNEAASTTSRDVSLYIYGTWTEMRLRNNSDAWTAWLPFSNRYNWQLPALTGNHTVDVELRKTGVTASSSDAIFLDYPLQPELGNLPEIITMTYSIPSQTLIPTSVQITPLNTGNSAALTWHASTNENWIDIQPISGSTPESITIQLTNFITDTVTDYSGLVTVSVTSPSGVIGSPHHTTVRLLVIDDPIRYHYLPSAVR